MSQLIRSPLDGRTTSLARQWGVSITDSQETPTGQVAFGRRASSPVVLKTVRRPGDEWNAGAVIDAFHGRGMVRLLEAVPGAVLLERLCPGTPVASLSLAGADDEAIRILADVLGRHAPGRAPEGTPTVQKWGAGFASYFASSDRTIAPALVQRAQAWYQHLANTQRRVRLLHGDFHHYNVLSDEKRGWVAIDPKGLVGELEYELGAVLRNPIERLGSFAAPRVIEHRLGLLGKHLRLNLDRVLAWSFAQAVLSVIWMVEDGQRPQPDDPTLLLARRLESMLPLAP